MTIHNKFTQLQIALQFFHQQDFLRVVNLAKFDLDHLIFRGLHRSSNEGSLDRQLAMAAIDQYAQLQAPGTAHAESASMAARVVRPV